MNKNLTDISFVSMLPGSIAEDETIKAAAESLDKELQSVNSGINELLIYSQIDTLIDADLLSHLAWAFKTPFWDEEFSIDKKRALVKQSIAWHKRRGTPSAVEDVIKTVFGEGELIEWFDYSGEPYHFKISTESILRKTSDYQTLYEGVESVKNKRSVLESIITKKNNNPVLYIGLASKIYIIEKKGVST
ncbi:MAG: phage tail protein I [Deltaproteobacteria bacterium]|nr:phage tail protein I [Deltaproteobacteria bacterium]